jgi:8-oxo-dGTP pyrophosphatase MutT (NUDIX family)
MQSNHQKVAVIVFTKDPEEDWRFLLRHNKPFNGYEDEWTVSFGTIEEGENRKEAAIREAKEEYGISEDFPEIIDLNYKISYTGKHGLTDIHFFACKLNSIDTKILLNEESIGYDWMKIEKVKEVMQYEDEKKAFDILLKQL